MGRRQYYTNAESVAIDVATEIQGVGGSPDLGRLADLGFQSFHLYVVAHSACEVLAEHLLAGVAYEKDTSHLLLSTLKNVYQAPTGWAGNETWAAALVVSYPSQATNIPRYCKLIADFGFCRF
jgi:hypothetical protein